MLMALLVACVPDSSKNGQTAEPKAPAQTQKPQDDAEIVDGKFVKTRKSLLKFTPW